MGFLPDFETQIGLKSVNARFAGGKTYEAGGGRDARIARNGRLGSWNGATAKSIRAGATAPKDNHKGARIAKNAVASGAVNATTSSAAKQRSAISF
jgi:hypothetical protein